MSARAPDLDAGALLGTFIRHGVAFVAVGGFAARLHGALRVTKDIDLCLDWDRDNLERAAVALRELDARLKIGVYVAVPIDSSLLARMEVATWRTPVGDVDLLMGIPRNARWDLADYKELRQRAAQVELGPLKFAIAALEDIIRSKEVADRPADREALPELHTLRDRQP